MSDIQKYNFIDLFAGSCGYCKVVCRQEKDGEGWRQ